MTSLFPYKTNTLGYYYFHVVTLRLFQNLVCPLNPLNLKCLQPKYASLSPLCQLFLHVLLVQKKGFTIPHTPERQRHLVVSPSDSGRGEVLGKEKLEGREFHFLPCCFKYAIHQT